MDTTPIALGRVHVHLVVSLSPPLIERHQSDGFLRATRVTGEFDDVAGEKEGESGADRFGDASRGRGDKKDADSTSSDDEQLRSWKGSFVWLLVRLQYSSPAPPHDQLRRACVQYQLTTATERYLLPLEHTNVRLTGAWCWAPPSLMLLTRFALF